MPLPPQNPRSVVSAGRKVNLPRAAVSSSSSPSRTWSCSQFDAAPPGTRFTVVVISPSKPGALENEYARGAGRPSTVMRKMQYWPASYGSGPSSGSSVNVRASAVSWTIRDTVARRNSGGLGMGLLLFLQGN